MGYVLMWIEGVTLGVLFVATVTAWAARRRPWLRLALPLAAAGLVLVKMGLLVAGSVWMRVQLLMPDWLGYTVSWAVVFAVAAAIVLARGLRLREGERAAAGWPAGRLLVGFIAAMSLHLVTFYNMDLSAEIQLAAAKAASGALALTAAPARVPDRLNAALVYRQAFDSIGEFKDLPPAWDKVWSAWACGRLQPPPADGEAPPPPFDPADPDLLKFLADHEHTLRLLRRAAAMPDCYFERPWGQPSIDMLLPEYALFQSSVRLLALDARVHLADDARADDPIPTVDTTAARGPRTVALDDITPIPGTTAARGPRRVADDLTAIFRTAAHVRSEPLLISTLVAMSADDIGHARLAEALASGKLGPTDLNTVRLDRNLSYMRAVGRSFEMEEAFGLACFAYLSPQSDYSVLDVLGSGLPRLSPALSSPLLSMWRVFLMPADLASYRRAMGRYREQCRKPYYANREAWKEEHEAFRKERHGIMTAMVLPALSRVASKAAEAQAGHELARAALASARYHAEKDGWPARLADLVPDYLPEVPVDPFDGKPLRMTTADGGTILYSVGLNGKDEGGREGGKDDTGDDVVFRLPAK